MQGHTPQQQQQQQDQQQQQQQHPEAVPPGVPAAAAESEPAARRVAVDPHHKWQRITAWVSQDSRQPLLQGPSSPQGLGGVGGHQEEVQSQMEVRYSMDTTLLELEVARHKVRASLQLHTHHRRTSTQCGQLYMIHHCGHMFITQCLVALAVDSQQAPLKRTLRQRFMLT
jgi:hypothetical protein